MTSPDRTHMQKHIKFSFSFFSTATHNQHRYQKTDYASVVLDSCGEIHLKKEKKEKRKKELPTSKSRQINLPDPSLSTEQMMRALGILNLPQQLAYSKGIFMHKVLNNKSPNYLAQLFISHQPHYTNSRNNLYLPRPRLDLFKTSISFAGASL